MTPIWPSSLWRKTFRKGMAQNLTMLSSHSSPKKELSSPTWSKIWDRWTSMESKLIWLCILWISTPTPSTKKFKILPKLKNMLCLKKPIIVCLKISENGKKTFLQRIPMPKIRWLIKFKYVTLTTWKIWPSQCRWVKDVSSKMVPEVKLDSSAELSKLAMDISSGSNLMSQPLRVEMAHYKGCTTFSQRQEKHYLSDLIKWKWENFQKSKPTTKFEKW